MSDAFSNPGFRTHSSFATSGQKFGDLFSVVYSLDISSLVSYRLGAANPAFETWIAHVIAILNFVVKFKYICFTKSTIFQSISLWDVSSLCFVNKAQTFWMNLRRYRTSSREHMLRVEIIMSPVLRSNNYQCQLYQLVDLEAFENLFVFRQALEGLCRKHNSVCFPHVVAKIWYHQLKFPLAQGGDLHYMRYERKSRGSCRGM